MTYQLSDDGLQAIIRRECAPPDFTPALTAYPDGAGYWTIGVGHRGSDIKQGTTITLAQAEAYLRSDLAWAEEAVNQSVKVQLTQNQYDALVSMVFNIGAEAFENSTLLKKLNAGNYAAVPSEMRKWVNSDNRPNPGLVNRRNSEIGQWTRGAQVSSASVIPDRPPVIPSSVKAVAATAGSAIAGAATGITTAVKGGQAQAAAAGGHWTIGIVVGVIVTVVLAIVAAVHTKNASTT